jgi:hypothetical protein
MAEERILGNLLVENLVAEDVTEDQIEAMYQKQVALQQDDDEVRIAHILVATKEEAQALFDRIQAGESFESLVSANSLDSATRMEQGDLGYVSPNDEPAPFPLVIANTGEGEVAPPFESADGWHILKVKDRRSRAAENARGNAAGYRDLPDAWNRSPRSSGASRRRRRSSRANRGSTMTAQRLTGFPTRTPAPTIRRMILPPRLLKELNFESDALALCDALSETAWGERRARRHRLARLLCKARRDA